jgi:hypothetical protein
MPEAFFMFRRFVGSTCQLASPLFYFVSLSVFTDTRYQPHSKYCAQCANCVVCRPSSEFLVVAMLYSVSRKQRLYVTVCLCYILHSWAQCCVSVIIWKAKTSFLTIAMLLFMTVVHCKVQRLWYFQWRNVHTKFRENPSVSLFKN